MDFREFPEAHRWILLTTGGAIKGRESVNISFLRNRSLLFRPYSDKLLELFLDWLVERGDLWKDGEVFRFTPSAIESSWVMCRGGTPDVEVSILLPLSAFGAPSEGYSRSSDPRSYSTNRKKQERKAPKIRLSCEEDEAFDEGDASSPRQDDRDFSWDKRSSGTSGPYLGNFDARDYWGNDDPDDPDEAEEPAASVLPEVLPLARRSRRSRFRPTPQPRSFSAVSSGLVAAAQRQSEDLERLTVLIGQFVAAPRIQQK